MPKLIQSSLCSSSNRRVVWEQGAPLLDEVTKKSPFTINFNHRLDKHLPGQFIFLETRSKENIHLGWLMNAWTGLMYCTFIHINTVRICHDLPSQHSLWEPLVCTRVISDRIGWITECFHIVANGFSSLTCSSTNCSGSHYYSFPELN